MDIKLTETLPTWVAPRLMRLNQADGTEKHVMWTESQNAPPGWCTINGGTDTDGSFGGQAGPGNCGPS